MRLKNKNLFLLNHSFFLPFWPSLCFSPLAFPARAAQFSPAQPAFPAQRSLPPFPRVPRRPVADNGARSSVASSRRGPVSDSGTSLSPAATRFGALGPRANAPSVAYLRHGRPPRRLSSSEP
jgi:hypothetical protein